MISLWEFVLKGTIPRCTNNLLVCQKHVITCSKVLPQEALGGKAKKKHWLLINLRLRERHVVT